MTTAQTMIAKANAMKANVEIDFTQEVRVPEKDWQSAWGNYTAYKAPFLVLGGIDNEKDLVEALHYAVNAKFTQCSQGSYTGNEAGFVYYESYFSIGD